MFSNITWLLVAVKLTPANIGQTDESESSVYLIICSVGTTFGTRLPEWVKQFTY